VHSHYYIGFVFVLVFVFCFLAKKLINYDKVTYSAVNFLFFGKFLFL